MRQLFGANRFLVMTGNYGSGKTEISLNLALNFSRSEKTTLVDLDIVNPYFRTGEKAEMLKKAGIRVLMPTFAMTTVDIPALPAEIQSVFELPSERVRGRLKIDLLINNTNLAQKTTPGMVEKGEKTVLRCAEKLGIKSVCSAGIQKILSACVLQTPALAITRFMAPEWMEDIE